MGSTTGSGIMTGSKELSQSGVLHQSHLSSSPLPSAAPLFHLTIVTLSVASFLP